MGTGIVLALFGFSCLLFTIAYLKDPQPPKTRLENILLGTIIVVSAIFVMWICVTTLIFLGVF